MELAQSNIIEAMHISYKYPSGAAAKQALDDVSVKVKKGEFLAVLGVNGSGKTTLARLLCALLPLQSGELNVADADAGDAKNARAIRQKCGMVFQDPESRFVLPAVGEDIAFGLRNYGTPEEDIPGKVSKALETVGLSGYEKRAVKLLKYGKQQLAATAGVVALEPEIVIFDEAGEMLDEEGRGELHSAIGTLRDSGKTIIFFTKRVEDVLDADRLLIMHQGKILALGKPRKLLSDPELYKKAELIPPMPVRAYFDLKKSGIELPRCPITLKELVDAVCRFR